MVKKEAKEFSFVQELKRKAVHILALGYILIYVFVNSYAGKRVGILSLGGLLVLFILLDYFRIERGKKIPYLHQFWRAKEKDRIGGQVFFLVGVIIAFTVFNFKVALAVILMTIFGDMASALIGKKFGKFRFKTSKKSIEGAVAEFVVDFVIGVLVFFWGAWNFSNWPLWLVVLVMAFMASYVETLINKMDDNLTIPVVAGFFGQLAWLLQGSGWFGT